MLVLQALAPAPRLCLMATITFRTDDEVDRAIADMSRGREVDRSTVIRDAILLAWRERQRQELRLEAERLARDPANLAEIKAVQEDLADLRAW